MLVTLGLPRFTFVPPFRLMDSVQYREIIAICSEIRTEQKNKQCEHNVEFLYVTNLVVYIPYSNH